MTCHSIPGVSTGVCTVKELGCDGWVQVRKNVSDFTQQRLAHKPGSRGQSSTIRTFEAKKV